MRTTQGLRARRTCIYASPFLYERGVTGMFELARNQWCGRHGSRILHADVVEAVGGRPPGLGSGPVADSPVGVQPRQEM